jgi:hypothetical protein
MIEGRQFSKGLHRQLSACPQCGTALRWATWPWRLLTGSAIAMVVAGISILFARESMTLVVLAIMLLFFVLFIGAAIRHRLIPIAPHLDVKGGRQTL